MAIEKSINAVLVAGFLELELVMIYGMHHQVASYPSHCDVSRLFHGQLMP
jgi:hypothetical protein